VRWRLPAQVERPAVAAIRTPPPVGQRIRPDVVMLGDRPMIRPVRLDDAGPSLPARPPLPGRFGDRPSMPPQTGGPLPPRNTGINPRLPIPGDVRPLPPRNTGINPRLPIPDHIRPLPPRNAGINPRVPIPEHVRPRPPRNAGVNPRQPIPDHVRQPPRVPQTAPRRLPPPEGVARRTTPSRPGVATTGPTREAACGPTAPFACR
jgi:hypothetical protein